jgi:DNA (cytosine-5)-methyltransferase 1
MLKLRFVDAFAGVGGFHYGIKDALGDRAECVLSIEKDKFATEVYKSNFPEVPMATDITKLDLESIPDHDLLCAGFPCQPFSVARTYVKDRLTIDVSDNRTNLFLYLYNICKYKKPKHFLFENVANLAKIKNVNGNLMIDDMTEMFVQLGYNIKYKVLDAKNFGVSQQRKRVFILGSLVKDDLKFPEPSSKISIVKDILDDNVDEKYFHVNTWKNKSLKDGSPSLDRLKELKRDVDKGNRYDKTMLVSEIVGETPSGRSRQNERVYSIYGVSPTLTTIFPMSFDVDGVFRSLTPRESFKLQGFPVEKMKLSNDDKQSFKQAGNAVCVSVVKEIIKLNFT